MSKAERELIARWRQLQHYYWADGEIPGDDMETAKWSNVGQAYRDCADDLEILTAQNVPEAVAGNVSAPVGEPSATVVSANESAVIPLDKLSEEWDRLDRYYSQLADVAAGAGYDKGSFIGKSIGFSVCAAQLRAALPASSGMGSGQPSGVGEPHVPDDSLVQPWLEQPDDRQPLPPSTTTPTAELRNFIGDKVMAATVKAYEEGMRAREVGEGLREALQALTKSLYGRPMNDDTRKAYDAARAALAAPAPKPAPAAERDRQ